MLPTTILISDDNWRLTHMVSCQGQDHQFEAIRRYNSPTSSSQEVYTYNYNQSVPTSILPLHDNRQFVMGISCNQNLSNYWCLCCSWLFWSQSTWNYLLVVFIVYTYNIRHPRIDIMYVFMYVQTVASCYWTLPNEGICICYAKN